MAPIRANVLAKGLSGIRPVVAERLCELLNRGVTPVVPSQGSVGASGDLAGARLPGSPPQQSAAGSVRAGVRAVSPPLDADRRLDRDIAAIDRTVAAGQFEV